MHVTASSTLMKSSWSLATLLFLFWASEGWAAGVIYGDEFQEIGPVSPQAISAAQTKTGAMMSTVGYHYHHLGPVWFSLWTWGGSYCLHHSQSNWDITQSEAGYFAGKNPDTFVAPFAERIPFGLFSLLLVGLGVGWFISKGKGWRDELTMRLLSRLPLDKNEIEDVAKKLRVQAPLPSESPLLTELASSSGKMKRPKSASSSGKLARPVAQDLKETKKTPPAPVVETFSLQQETPVMAGGMGSTVTRMVSQDELKATLRDPLYQKAVKMVLEGSSSLSGLSTNPNDRQIELKVGLDFLVKNGIDKVVARPRLIAAVRAVARAQRRRLQGGETQS